MTADSAAAANPPPRRSATIRIAAGGGLALVAAIAFGVYWCLLGRYIESTDNAYVRADVVSVSPRVAGYLSEVAVADNQAVHAGDVLARIDDQDYRARVQQAEGAVAEARADIAGREAAIASLEAQQVQQRDLIAQADAEAQGGAAEARRADLEYQRQQSLSRQQASSAQLLEAAAADAQRSAAAVTAARASLAGRRDRVPALAAEQRAAAAALEKARAVLLRAEAGLALARIDLDRTVIRAPADGTVGQRTLRIGQYVESGMPLLAVVPNEVYVVANYKETQLGRIAPGQPVKLEVDAFGGAALTGRVDSFSPASGAEFALLPPDNATGNFTKIVQRVPLRIRIDPGQPRLAGLRPGMSVVAAIDTRRGAGDGR